MDSEKSEGRDPHRRAPTTYTSHTTKQDEHGGLVHSTCATGRCEPGEPCSCQSLTAQLSRRREASHRLPPLACGRRDPSSRAVG